MTSLCLDRKEVQCATLRVHSTGTGRLFETQDVLRFSRYSYFFIFCKNPRWPTKMAKIENFPLLHRTLLYYPAGQKFTRNRSISYGFRDIHTFSFSAKIQDGRQKWQKLKIFPFCIGHSCTTLRVKNSLEIPLSLTVFEIFTLFHFLQKSKMAAKSGEN